MILTLTIEQNNSVLFDIQVPSQQRITDTLDVLRENRLISMNDINMKVYSERNQSELNIEHSYEENWVFTADILHLIGEKRNEETFEKER